MTIKHDGDIKANKEHKWRSEYPNALITHFSEAECHENVFSESELTELTDFMWNQSTTWEVSQSGNLYRSGNLEKLFEIVKDKLRPYVDVDMATSIQANFFHTPHEYGIHTDMPERGEWQDQNTPYKSVLIPLYLLPRESNCRIVFFHPRVADVGITFDRNSSSQSHYDSFTDYSTIPNVYNVKGKKIIIDEDNFPQKELDRIGLTNKSRLKGLKVEKDFNWKPGNLMVFDTAQVHTSTEGTFITKGGLRISLMRTL